MRVTTILALLCACRPDAPSGDDSAIVQPVPWSPTRGALHGDIGLIRDLRPMRGIAHLHSPWSHDACDGEPLLDGQPDPDCLASLRKGLCDAAIDAAWLTDHETHASDQDYEALLYCPEGVCADGDQLIEEDGEVHGVRITCADGHQVVWSPGLEAGLMPVGLHRHVSDDPSERAAIYGERSAEAIDALQGAGARVLLAHTEGEPTETLLDLQSLGLQGVEIFNLHAAFDPDIREEFLGLEGLGWLGDLGPFLDGSSAAEPDLFVLAVLAAQAPSLDSWDALLAQGPMVGTAGTDAHENVMPALANDGERFDSYRRMLSWFTNVLLVPDVGTPGPAELSDTLASGRLYVNFEVLGTASGFDVHLIDAQGEVWEMGSDAPPGTLVVTCPTLSAASPRGLESPEIAVRVLKDGQPWQDGCGEFSTSEAGVYRVEVDIIPWHLRDFLGDEPDSWLHSYPWIFSNPVRVGF